MFPLTGGTVQLTRDDASAGLGGDVSEGLSRSKRLLFTPLVIVLLLVIA